MRFATRALPATAATAGSANGSTSAATVPGSNTVSPSISTRMSCRAAAMPALSAAGLPELAWRITRTFASARPSTRSAVPSVDPSSTTMISTGWVEAASDRTVASMVFSSL